MKDLSNAIAHCYRELYAHSTPPASFDDLLKNAMVDGHGKLHIPMMDHEIDQKLFMDIVEDTIVIFKITSGIDKRRFRSYILLGCSPKFKMI